jgi:hypothetical protein
MYGTVVASARWKVSTWNLAVGSAFSASAQAHAQERYERPFFFST